MRKRRILLIGMPVGVVAIVGLVMVLTREREPEYGGKRLSEWVESTAPAVIFEGNRSQIGVSPANAKAIHQIGTNAVPYLLTWIRYQPPLWKTIGIPIAKRIFHSALVDHQARRADGAMTALINFGASAEVEVLVNNTRFPKRDFRAQILDRIDPFDQDRIDPAVRKVVLLNLLRDPDRHVRVAATNALRKIDPAALEKVTR